MIKTYKCPGCGGELIYDAGTDHLKCPRCSREVAFADVQHTDLSQRAADESKDQAGSGKLTYECPNCGAPLTADQYTASTFCSYCNAPMLIESRFTGNVKPSRILPFQFDKKQAQQNFKAWKGSGPLPPSSFKSSATMDKVKGVYVPYWLYSYTASGEYEGLGEKHTVSRTAKEEVITIESFDIRRSMETEYAEVPVNASGTYPSAELSVLEPYDHQKLTAFAEHYLPGYFADLYEKTSEELTDGVQKAIRNSADEGFREKIGDGYDEVELSSALLDLRDEVIEYAMLPVYVLNFKYGGKNYPLYMNGETGKIQGELPISKGKLASIFAVAFIICFLVTFLFGRVL